MNDPAARPEVDRRPSFDEPPARSFFHYVGRPLQGWQRLVIVGLCIALGLSFAFPLWRISMTAPQYPNGLYLDIWTYRVTGGDDGQHISEINTLNHYIGMRRIERETLHDLDWLPFALGGLVLLGLRTALLGNVRTLIDMAMIAAYVTLFAFGRFIYMLWQYGHELDPEAPMNIEPFTPVIFGSKKVANFMTYSYPQPGSYLLGVFVVGLWAVVGVALWSGWRSRRRLAMPVT